MSQPKAPRTSAIADASSVGAAGTRGTFELPEKHGAEMMTWGFAWRGHWISVQPRVWVRASAGP